MLTFALDLGDSVAGDAAAFGFLLGKLGPFSSSHEERSDHLAKFFARRFALVGGLGGGTTLFHLGAQLGEFGKARRRPATAATAHRRHARGPHHRRGGRRGVLVGPCTATLLRGLRRR